MMCEPIEQGAGQALRAEDFGPLLERKVGSDQRCTTFLALAEHLEQQFGAGLGQRHEA